MKSVLLESTLEGTQRSIDCDFLCLAPNSEPVTALLSQADAKLTYDEVLGAMVPSQLPDSVYAAGDVTGFQDVEVHLLQGRIAGLKAAAASGAGGCENNLEDLASQLALAESSAQEGELSSSPFRSTVGKRFGRTKRFVCLCEDVTEKDVRQAIDEGFADVQSLKRYSTVSMGPCQGKMCHKSYTYLISEATGRGLDSVGGTTPRPPFRPTPLGAIAGPGHMPFRMTPIHHAHVRAGGRWRRSGSGRGRILTETRLMR